MVCVRTLTLPHYRSTLRSSVFARWWVWSVCAHSRYHSTCGCGRVHTIVGTCMLRTCAERQRERERGCARCAHYVVVRVSAGTWLCAVRTLRGCACVGTSIPWWVPVLCVQCVGSVRVTTRVHGMRQLVCGCVGDKRHGERASGWVGAHGCRSVIYQWCWVCVETDCALCVLCCVCDRVCMTVGFM